MAPVVPVPVAVVEPKLNPLLPDARENPELLGVGKAVAAAVVV